MRTKSFSCFFCGGPLSKSKTTPARPAEDDNNNNEEVIINAWEEKCVVSTCRMLNIPPTHSAVGAMLEVKEYCGGCVQVMRDLDFSVRAIDKLQRNIRKLRRVLLDKLDWKSQTMDTKTDKETSKLIGDDGQPSDLFTFVLQKAKEVTNEDRATSLAESFRSSKPKPIVKFHAETDTASLSLLDPIVIKEEIVNFEDGLDYEDFSIPPADENEEGPTSEALNVTNPNEESSSSLANVLRIRKHSSVPVPLEEDDDESSNDKAFSIKGYSGDENFTLNDSDHGESSDSSNSIDESEDDEEDGEWVVRPKSSPSKNEKTRSTTRRRTGGQQRKDSSGEKIPKRRRKTIPCTISCPYSGCDVMVKSPNALDKHIKRLHRENLEKFFTCSFCQKTFPYNANLKMHVTSVHAKEYAMANKAKSDSYKASCSFCGLPQKPEELESHENLHRARETPFSCLICDDAKFLRAPELVRHMQNCHPSSNSKQCHYCGKWFKTPHTLSAHVFQLHEFALYTHFKCSYCKKAFKKSDLWENHEKVCHHNPDNKNKDVCEKCGKVYPNKFRLKAHLATHEEAKYKCKVCDKVFHRPTSLVKHEELHAGLKFPCPDCPMVFNTKRYLESHSKRHLPRVLRRYPSGNPKKRVNHGGVCPDGNKCTRKHTLIHYGFPFKCESCPKTFRALPLLKKHAKSHIPKEVRMQMKISKQMNAVEDSSSSSSESSDDSEDELEVNDQFFETINLEAIKSNLSGVDFSKEIPR